MLARRPLPHVNKCYKSNGFVAGRCSAYFLFLKYVSNAMMNVPTLERWSTMFQSKKSIRVTSFLREERSRHIETACHADNSIRSETFQVVALMRGNFFVATKKFCTYNSRSFLKEAF